MWDICSPTRDQLCVPCIARQGSSPPSLLKVSSLLLFLGDSSFVVLLSWLCKATENNYHKFSLFCVYSESLFKSWYVSTLVEGLLTDGLNAYNKDTKCSHHIRSFKMMSSHSPSLMNAMTYQFLNWLLRDSGKFIGQPTNARSTLAWQWACQSTQGGDGISRNSAPDTIFRCTHPPFHTCGAGFRDTGELLRREMCSHSQMGISESLDRVTARAICIYWIIQPWSLTNDQLARLIDPYLPHME